MDTNDNNTSNGGDDMVVAPIKQEASLEETINIKTEPETAIDSEKISYEAVLAFLRNKGLKGTEDLLKQELGDGNDNNDSQITDKGNASQITSAGIVQSNTVVKSETASAEVSNVLSSYKSEGDPSIYADAYKDLQRFVETSLDLYRHELALILVSRLF